MTNQIIINTDQSSKRLIILVSILTSLSVTLAFNLLSYGLPARAVNPVPTVALVPTIASISPVAVQEGSPNTTITINGTGFINGNSIVRWRNNFSTPTTITTLTTTYVSATQLTAEVPATLLVKSAWFVSIAVLNSGPGGGISDNIYFEITSLFNLKPTITGLSPVSAAAGSASFTLNVSGLNFTSYSIVKWNNFNLTTTYVSATQLTAAVPATLLTTAGFYNITVFKSFAQFIFNSTPPQTSNPVAFTVTQGNNTGPTVTLLNPSIKLRGSPAFTLTVTGTNFVNDSAVLLLGGGGVTLTTTYVSATQLTAAVPAALLTTAGIFSIRVQNPAGGGLSNALPLVVYNPSPTITSIFPAQAQRGSPAFTLTVTGTNFVNGSIVTIDNVNRPTTFISATQLTAAVSAAILTTTNNSVEINVFNPAPSGGISNSEHITITPLKF